MENPENVVPQVADRQGKVKELTDFERVALVSMLLVHVKDGTLERGLIANYAQKFGVRRETVSRLWSNCTLSRTQGHPAFEEILSKKSNRGRKQKWDREAVQEAVREIPFKKRKTVGSTPGHADQHCPASPGQKGEDSGETHKCFEACTH